MREEPDTWHVVAALAKAQGGVVSTAQLRAAGVSTSAIGRRAQAGQLHRLHRGVYAVGHTDLGAVGRRHAAVLACGGVISHRTAADAWDLLAYASGAVDVSVPVAGGRKRRTLVRIHRVPDIGEHTTTLGALPITTPERTLLDIAAIVRPRQLERAVAQAEHLRIVDHAKLDALTASQRRGVKKLRAALSAPATTTRSELEERFLALCERHGIERPRVNERLGPYEVDFLWPKQHLIVETDGHQHHGTRAAFEQDRTRDAHLTAAGYRVVRFTYRQVLDEPALTAGLGEALLRRA